MSNFKKGDRVKHLVFGFGTVLTETRDGRVDVHFDTWNQGKDTLSQDSLVRVETGKEKFNEEEWLAAFSQVEPETEHYLGSHWTPFFEQGAEDLRPHLQEYIREARLVNAYASLLPAPRKHPPAWSQGVYLAWPDQQAGMQIALATGSTVNEVVALFPIILQGSYHSIIIQRVIVWHNGLVAQITAELGDALITFFDIHFIINRAWYVAGGLYQFALTGIAYACQPADNKPMVIDPPPQWIQDVRREGKFEPFSAKKPDQALEIHLGGMAVLLPIEEWDQDDYFFRGPLKAIKEVEIFGQKAWLLTTTVMRRIDGNADVDLDVLVTRRAWQGESPPQIGADIEGRLWLQGHLSGPGEPEEEKW